LDGSYEGFGMFIFDNYPDRGRRLVGRPQGATARHNYGPQVAQYCGWNCAYCGRDLLTCYESWLDLQVDHVVPTYSTRDGIREDWVCDIANCVVCCAACNTFLNRYRIKGARIPSTEAEFFQLRDSVFAEKKELACKRHKEERNYWRQKTMRLVESIQVFMDNDSAFLQWVLDNPCGFVVNCYEKPSPKYLILHTAKCKTIRRLVKRDGNWVSNWTKPFIKVCSTDITQLEEWAKTQVGGELQPCGVCNKGRE